MRTGAQNKVKSSRRICAGTAVLGADQKGYAARQKKLKGF